MTIKYEQFDSPIQNITGNSFNTLLRNGIIANSIRNQNIVDLAIQRSTSRSNVVILCRQSEHVKLLIERLSFLSQDKSIIITVPSKMAYFDLSLVDTIIIADGRHSGIKCLLPHGVFTRELFNSNRLMSILDFNDSFIPSFSSISKSRKESTESLLDYIK